MKKKFVLPIGAGVVVFGVVTAFAASLTVNTDSLAAGNAAVAACQDTAHVAYTHTGTQVTGADVTFSNGTSGDCDGMTAEVTLTKTVAGTPPVTTTLGVETAPVGDPQDTTQTNVAHVDFTSDNVNVADVTGVEVVITG